MNPGARKFGYWDGVCGLDMVDQGVDQDGSNDLDRIITLQSPTRSLLFGIVFLHSCLLHVQACPVWYSCAFGFIMAFPGVLFAVESGSQAGGSVNQMAGATSGATSAVVPGAPQPSDLMSSYQFWLRHTNQVMSRMSVTDLTG